MANLELISKMIKTAQIAFEASLPEKTKLSFAQESQFAFDILKASDYLAKLEPDSIKRSIVQVALIGLTLNPALKYCYLIPRAGKCTLDISYIGMIKILTDAGFIKNIDAAVVYEKDIFEFVRGSEPYLKHIQQFKSKKVLGAYAIAYFREGGYQAEFMPLDEINKVKATSESLKNTNTAKYSPWTNWESEMQKKTVLKRLFKLLPKKEISENLISMLNSEHSNTMNDLINNEPKDNKQKFDDIFEDAEIVEEKPVKKEPIKSEPMTGSVEKEYTEVIKKDQKEAANNAEEKAQQEMIDEANRQANK